MAAEPISYEPLSPLSLSFPTDSPPPLPVANLEPYSVFRSEISLETPDCRSPETAAQDYFSLDFEEERAVDLFSTPAPADSPAPERLLESGWFRANCGFKSPMLQLHKEILDFCDFLSPTRDEEVSRNAAIERVSDVIRYIWPSCKVEVFGSFKTGLYLPTSDIDVVILESNIDVPQKGLKALARALTQRGVAKKIQVIGRARVPIIKFVEKESGVSFDISFDAQNGPKAAEFIKNAIFKWPPLRPLCLILKVFLQQRQLNEVYTGGIGSYALLTMLMAMLQSLRELKRCTEKNLGVLLVNFFDMYGRKLNTSDVGVSCNGSGTFFLKNSRGFNNKSNGRGCFIAIEDPQAPENDIGKGSFGYYQVKSAFTMALSTLTNTKLILNLGPDRSILGTIIRPDPVLLERKGGYNGDMTFNELLPGAGESLHFQSNNNQQTIYCNWQLDDEEEPLPRGKIADDVYLHTPSAKKSKKKRKLKQNSETVEKKKKQRSDSKADGGSGKEKGKKKKRYTENGNGDGSNSRRFQRRRGAGRLFNQSA